MESSQEWSKVRAERVSIALRYGPIDVASIYIDISVFMVLASEEIRCHDRCGAVRWGTGIAELRASGEPAL
jgi:hypothetical protein